MELPDGGGGDLLVANEAVANVANQEELRLQRLREWLQMCGVQFRGCEIKPSDEDAGLGVFASRDNAQGVLMVTPLYLAITPTSVMQDPDLGPYFMRLMEESQVDDLDDDHVDDRLLIILFLVIERARGRFSFWAPWLDVLPTEFRTTIFFSDEELLELEGTHLFQATKTRLRSLKSSFETRAKPFADNVLSCVKAERREVEFQDFLWANSIFWTRAKSIPCPRSVVFPDQPTVLPASQSLQLGTASTDLQLDKAFPETTDSQIATNGIGTCSEYEFDSQIATNDIETCSEYELAPCPSLADENDMVVSELSSDWIEAPSAADDEDVMNPSTISVEGLVPGIDFCNHDRMALALWEVDGPKGSETGVPNSMYLVSLRPEPGVPYGEEIFISYGSKSNEELLFLYGFVLEDNPDDYLMIYIPAQALEASDCSETKKQLLNELKLPLRYLVPSSELRRGFYEELNLDSMPKIPLTGHSWTGHRKTSPLANKVVFPEDLLTALRIVAMGEEEVYRVASMLEDISDPEAGRIPTNADIRAAVWEVCGNSGAFQLLVDLLTSNMMALEKGTGTEAMDAELLAKDGKARSQIKEQSHSDRVIKGDEPSDCNLLSDNKRASVIYRMGQKRLVRGFLQEAEMALEVCLDHVSSD
ncbi:hypothetical protein M758_12G021100 [Ceratodon purpureus]|nr:hypothetical protein M758_12G021100 [Ceratodon purpureus]